MCAYRSLPSLTLCSRSSGIRIECPYDFRHPPDGHRRDPVFGCEMGAPLHHLKRPVAEQLCHCAQIHPGHNESTGKGAAVAMPVYSQRPSPLPKRNQSWCSLLIFVRGRSSQMFASARAMRLRGTVTLVSLYKLAEIRRFAASFLVIFVFARLKSV